MTVDTISATVQKWSTGTTFNDHPSSTASYLYTNIKIRDNAFNVSDAQITLINPDGKNKNSWSAGDHLKIISNNTDMFYGKVEIPRYSSGGFVINLKANGSRNELKAVEITKDNPQSFPIEGSESSTDTVPEIIEYINAYTVHPYLDNFDDKWTFDIIGPTNNLDFSREVTGTAFVTVSGVTVDRAFSDISNAVGMTWYVDDTTQGSVKLYLVPNEPGACNGSSHASYGFDDFQGAEFDAPNNRVKSCLLWDFDDSNRWNLADDQNRLLLQLDANASEYLILNDTSWTNIGSPSNCNAIMETMVFFDQSAEQESDVVYSACIRADLDGSNDMDDFYCVELSYGNTDNCKMRKRRNGSYTTFTDCTISIPSDNNEQHILAISARSTSAGVVLNGYVDNELRMTYTDSSSTISGGKPGIFFSEIGGAGRNFEVDNIGIFPSTVSYTYDLDSGDIIDLSGGQEVTTAYNDIKVYGAIAIAAKHRSAAVRNRSPPRPLGEATDTRSISSYGRRSLTVTNLEVKRDGQAKKSAQKLIHELRKPRVRKTIQIPGTTTLPNKFEDLIRIECDDTGNSGLYWVREKSWEIGSNGYKVSLVCEERFLE
jgi:hypothetical protein